MGFMLMALRSKLRRLIIVSYAIDVSRS